MKIQKAVLLPDIHYPQHSVESMKSVLKFLADFRPDTVIYQGDQLDMSVISHWNKDKKRKVELKRVKSDYDGFDKDILSPIEKIVGKRCEKVWITGNHEDWAQQYLDRNPELEGMIEPEICLRLEERGYEYVPLNGIYKLGKLNIIHGFYHNQYHSAKHVSAFGGSVAYCHTHTSQEFTKVSPVDTRQFHSATGLPCLCDLSPDYMKNRPSAWVHGFGVVYVMPDGTFNLYRIIMVDNKFIFNDKVYG
jgi:hypothetical protein